MSYIEGLVAAVPTANKDVLRQQAAEAAPLFKQFGATRVVEVWGDDIPQGTLTDFKGAVKAKPDEQIVLSWIEYPDKQARDSANRKILADPKLKKLGEKLPFDGERAILAGFTPLLEEGEGGKMGYTDSYLVAVPAANKQAYRAMAAKTAKVFKEHGATRVVEAWGDDIPTGKITDYKGAVKARDDETVVLSFVEWPSKQVRDEALPKVMRDARLKADQDNLPFDERRMIHGGFKPLLDTARY